MYSLEAEKCKKAYEEVARLERESVEVREYLKNVFLLTQGYQRQKELLEKYLDSATFEEIKKVAESNHCVLKCDEKLKQ